MEERKRPLVGVTSGYIAESDKIWSHGNYPDCIVAAGGIPVLLPLTEDPETARRLADALDGILFTGGEDVSPTYYGESVLNHSVVCNERRDRAEMHYFKAFREAGKPILGICRGCQLINVAMGGSLYQDLDTQYPGALPHRKIGTETQPVHKVVFTARSFAQRVLGAGTETVNSFHHQAVRTLAPGLREEAHSEDGIIEAFSAEYGPYLFAVQWHPERSGGKNAFTERMTRDFVLACAETG